MTGRRRGQLPDPTETPRPELCDFCGTTPIRWYRTEHNQPMAVDAEPDPDRGNVRIVAGIAKVIGDKAKAAAQRAAGQPLYLPHRVTCPRRDLWPKPKKPTRVPDKTRETGTRRGMPAKSRDARRGDRASPPAGPQPGPATLFDLPTDR